MQGGSHNTADDARLRRARRLARVALELYGLGDDVHPELLGHGFSQLFRVRTSSRDGYALRLYGVPSAAPSEGVDGSEARLWVGAALRSPEVLRSQLRWLATLRSETGLPVPEPVPTVEGDLVGVVGVEGTPWVRHCALVGWVPGEHREARELSEEDAARVGSLLAVMHDYARGYRPSGEESVLPRWDRRWPFGERVPLWSEGPTVYSEAEMGAFREAARRVEKNLAELGEGLDAFGVVHRDPNLRNLLFSERGAGLVDFDMAGWGHYLLDLCVLRTSLRTLPEERRRDLWGAFLGAYERARPLPERVHEGMDRYLTTFAVMQRVAAINRQLALLKEGQQGTRSPRFLRTSLTWLSRRASRLGA